MNKSKVNSISPDQLKILRNNMRRSKESYHFLWRWSVIDKSCFSRTQLTFLIYLYFILINWIYFYAFLCPSMAKVWSLRKQRFWSTSPLPNACCLLSSCLLRASFTVRLKSEKNGERKNKTVCCKLYTSTCVSATGAVFNWTRRNGRAVRALKSRKQKAEPRC